MNAILIDNFLNFLNWLPGHESVLGEWKYSSTHSLTSGLDGGDIPCIRKQTSWRTNEKIVTADLGAEHCSRVSFFFNFYILWCVKLINDPKQDKPCQSGEIQLCPAEEILGTVRRNLSNGHVHRVALTGPVTPRSDEAAPAIWEAHERSELKTSVRKLITYRSPSHCDICAKVWLRRVNKSNKNI